MKKNIKSNPLFKTIVIVIVLIALVFATVTVIKKLQYSRYPKFTQKVFAVLDKYDVSHDEEIVLDFREVIVSKTDDNEVWVGGYTDEDTGVTRYDKVQKSAEGIVFECSYEIEGTNITIKTSDVANEHGIAKSNGPSEEEILERLKEELKKD